MTEFDGNAHDVSENEKIDVKKYIHGIVRNWWWFAIALFCSVIVAYMVNRYAQKQYQVSCSIILNNGNGTGNGVESLVQDLTKSGSQQSALVIDNEISILKSKLLARMTLQQLDFGITYTKVGRRGIAETELYNSSPFIIVPDTSLPCLSNIRIQLTFLSPSSYKVNIDNPWNITQVVNVREPFRSGEFNFVLNPRTPESLHEIGPFPQSYYITVNSLRALSNQYSEALSVRLNNDRGSVLILTLSGTNGEKLCDYLNKLSDVYALYSLDLKNSASSNAIHFIDSQLDYITESLHVTGNRLQDFRTSERVLDLSQESTGLYSLVNELNTEKARLSINRTYYEYLKKYFEDKQSNSDIIAPSVVGIGDKLLDEMVAAVNRLIIKKRELSADNMESNPILRNIDNQLESQRKDIIENLNNLIVVNDIALKNTALRADSAEREIQRLPFTERQLANIKREYAISDNIYTFLLQKRAETSITLASNSADNRVLDKALAEDVKSISPRYSTNYFIAVVAGTLIPLIIILVNESLSNKIKSLQEIESLTSIPIAGKIGHNNNIEPVPVMSHSKSQLAESFRSLRSNLQYFGLGSNNHILSVTSTVSGEGKTFCAVNLAASMAMTGRRVLLVSLDLRRPKIHHIFNLKNDTGLSNYLAGLCTVDEVISATNYPNLSVALSGPVPPNPAEMIESKRMTEFFESVKAGYDTIVIDTPPVAFVTDALLLSKLIDLQLFVIRHEYSRKDLLQMINELYRNRGNQNMALVINDIKEGGISRYGYRYGYYYGYCNNGGYSQEVQENLLVGSQIIESLKKKFGRSLS